ncbi:MAG TPA: hypothetical protein VFA77_10500 [Candidatus Eisenbacteria bacterium]|nr:hypothetical protein [Candidatus Eisenbacteria bacterium]
MRGPGQREVAMFLSGRTALVSPQQDGCVVVFDKESEEQDQHVIADLGSRLSRRFNCPVLAMVNHDDDILWYQLFLDGKLADEYDSTPGFFDRETEPAAPEGGDAAKLCVAFESGNSGEVEEILRRPSFGENAYTFALERHADLVRVLGISTFGVGAGYHYLCDGQLPEGLDASDLVWAR